MKYLTLSKERIFATILFFMCGYLFAYNNALAAYRVVEIPGLPTSTAWRTVKATPDGQQIIAVSSSLAGYIYVSTDSGVTWIPQISLGSKQWVPADLSDDGAIMAVASDNNDEVYGSFDSGQSWAVKSPLESTFWSGLSLSSDGAVWAAAETLGDVYVSTSSGSVWNNKYSQLGSGYWTSIAVSPDGSKLAVSNYDNEIFVSSNYGATWTMRTIPGAFVPGRLVFSGDSQTLFALDGYENTDGYIYASTNLGANWTQLTGAGQRVWSGLTLSGDGSTMFASDGHVADRIMVLRGYLYASKDSGTTWSPIISAGERQWITLSYAYDAGVLYAAELSGAMYSITEDSQGPSISNIVPNVTSDSATFSFTTTDGQGSVATTTLSWGLVDAMNQSQTNIGLTSHNFTLNNLVSCTQYQYQIVSGDDLANIATSTGTFSTQGCPRGRSGSKKKSVATVTRSVPLPVQVTAPSVPNVQKSGFTKNLHIGMKDVDVFELQRALNSLGFVIAQTGPGSPGNETQYFGPLTVQALSAFQKSKSISPSYGYFGPLSQAAIRAAIANPVR